IAALPFVLEARPDARLLIVGSGPYEPQLREAVSKLGLVDRGEFTSIRPGDSDGMAKLLSSMGLVVLMSEYETHPQAALEAAAVRRRLLVADDGGGLRELAEDGLARSILLVSSASELAEAIVEELDKPAATVRPRLTSWDQCVDELVSVYELVGRG